MKLCIIPARGGSKRIPNKNIKAFLGKPIIAYSIEAALQSGCFEEVMVSTDSEQIAEVAKEYRAKLPFLRSAKNADDYATTVDVILEVLDNYSSIGKEFEYACCIYPTAPFISPELLKDAFEILINKKFKSVFPVLPYSFPIQRALKLNEDHKIAMFQPQHLHTRSQDLEQAYHDSGQFYWFDTQSIKKEKKLWTNNTGVVVLSEMDAHDIDTLADWEVAEWKYKVKKDGKKN